MTDGPDADATEKRASLRAAPDPSRGETRAERLQRMRADWERVVEDDAAPTSTSTPRPAAAIAPSHDEAATDTLLREYSDVEYVFEPHAQSLPDKREYLRVLWERREFISALARADLSARSASTTLGRIWEVLDPLFQSAIYFFLFVVLSGGGGAGSSRPAEFLVVLIGGIFMFRLTLGALSEGGQSIRRAKNLMLNSTFPRALLPIAALYKELLAFVPAAVVYAVLFFPLGGTLGAGIFVFPLLFVIQLAMNLGIALLVATIVVFYRDASNAVNYVNRILFFATPVIYPVDLLPPGILPLLAWQPLFPLFASYQRVFAGQVPNAGVVLAAAAWAVVLLVVGVKVFTRHEREFAMHL